MKKSTSYILTLLLLVGVMVVGMVQGYRHVELAEENEEFDVEENHGVPFANYFIEYSDTLGWDWQMLAALCYHESRFNPHAQSRSGARGLMQLMPKTAKRFGLNDSTIWIPEDNIRAGVKYILRLQEIYSFIGNKSEQAKFVLASYNAGTAHVMDARRLAKKNGANPYVWHGETAVWMNNLQYDEYVADTLTVRYGRFNPTETLNYVSKVMRTYGRLMGER